MFEGRSEVALPVESWLTKQDAILGLVLSSFVINVLGLVFPICVLQFYDRIIPYKSNSTLVAMVVLIVVALIFETVLKILRAYVSSWSGARFTYNIGKVLYSKLIYTDLNDFERHTAGEYLDRFNSAESLREYYCGQNLVMIVDLPFVVVYFALMFVINKYMVIMPILVTVVMLIITYLESNKTFVKLEGKKNITEAKSRFLIETISGIHTIKSLGMEEQFLRRYERLHQNEIKTNYEMIQRTSQSTRAGNLYSQVAVILTVSLGGILVINHGLSVGGLAASILLVGKIMQPITKLVSFVEHKQTIGVAKEDLDFILNFKPEFLPNLNTLEDFKGEIELRNVSFKYPGSDKYLFQNINFRVAPNEVVVIHGGGFSGKTTLMLMICSLFKPTEGTVLIDGMDIKQINLEVLRHKIAFMPDAGELFNGTIMENLTLFEPEKYEAQAIEIAKAIGLHDVVEAMPNSYKTEVGSGTVDLLSKGHKQLVLIVRALIGDPKVILFDEANVALDIDTDVKLRKYLMSKKGKCSMVLVTHRPSLIEMADKHYKLENERLVEFKWK
jgi:ATP-binding cassette, subfamily C, bacterial LapB